jgi:hypothetical protein
MLYLGCSPLFPKLYAEVQKIYRECSPAAAKQMCRLAVEAEDERELRASSSAI